MQNCILEREVKKQLTEGSPRRRRSFALECSAIEEEEEEEEEEGDHHVFQYTPTVAMDRIPQHSAAFL